jgi:hypothetical protein
MHTLFYEKVILWKSCLEVVCRFNHGSRIYLKTKVTKATTEERTQSQMGVFCSLMNRCFYFVCCKRWECSTVQNLQHRLQLHIEVCTPPLILWWPAYSTRNIPIAEKRIMKTPTLVDIAERLENHLWKSQKCTDSKSDT